MTPEEIYRATLSRSSLADTSTALLNHIKEGTPLVDRDKSIIAQNAGTTAANLLSAAIGAGAFTPASVEELLSEFDGVRTLVFNGTLTLAGAQSVVESFEGGGNYTAPANDNVRPINSGGGGGSRPHADVEMKVGKYRGKSIGEVYDLGSDGVSYLEWAADKLNNDWLRTRIAEFLAA